MLYMNKKMLYTYVGVDVHKQTHTAYFMNCFYEKIGEISFSSIPSEFDAFYDKAKKFCLPGTTFAWGLEDVSLYGRTFAKFLLAKGELVKHVNSTLVAGERKSLNTTTHKTDSVDAQCAARVLFSRFDEMPLARADDKYFVLKNMVTRYQATVKMRVAFKNQLHGLLMDPYPSYQTLFPTLCSKSSLAFLDAYPTPHALHGISVDELTDFLQKISKNKLGKAKAKQIITAIEKEKTSHLDYESDYQFIIRSLIRQLHTCLAEVDIAHEQIVKFLNHFDYPLMTLKGVNAITAARFIVEIGPIDRFPNAASLAKFAGISPITYASGKQDNQHADTRGNRKLNELFFRLAIHQAMPVGSNQVSFNPLFADYYQKKVSEGKTKKQALKAVSRRLVNIIYSMMKNNEDYMNPPMNLPNKAQAPNSA